MGQIENMFNQLMEKNPDTDAQLASHNTSIRNLEVQLGQISQALNTNPKWELPSDTMVNPKGGNNTGHAMAVTTRSGEGGDAPTSSQRKIMDDEKVVQEYEIPNNMVQANDEVRIDIDDNAEEAHEEVNLSRKHIVDIPEPVVQKAKAPMPRPPPPYPQRLAKQNGDNQLKKFMNMMKSLSINVPLVEALEQIPSYAKFMKDLVTKERSMNFETIKMTHQASTIVLLMAPKLKDHGAFTIPCTIRSVEFAKALCNLRANINLMSYLVLKTLGIGKLRPTSMRLQMVDRTVKRPLGVIDDVLVRVDKFILPANFVIRDCEVNEVPIILGRYFLATDETSDVMNVDDTFEVVFHNCDDEEMEGYMECVNSLQGMWSYTYEPRKLSLDLENRTAHPTKPSIEESLILD
ncbi:uncharacterized protein [Nicotiana sylvestris]|uniref:uncharacterized protein n=1 Tax=Nicotiana sylvestris TaxID=4096 RepID=UPI00388CA614